MGVVVLQQRPVQWRPHVHQSLRPRGLFLCGTCKSTARDFSRWATLIQQCPDFVALRESTECQKLVAHRFSVYHLVGRSGSLNTLSLEDLILVSTFHQGIRFNFRCFMMKRVKFMVDKILRQKVISSKRPICLPYGMSICKLLESLDFLTLGLCWVAFHASHCFSFHVSGRL